MGRYQGLSAAFVERLDAATASLEPEQYVQPDMSFMDAVAAELEAIRHGRPFSKRPPNAFDEARDAERRRIAEAEGDPDGYKQQFLQRMLDLKRNMANDPGAVDLNKQLAQAKKDMIAEIQREQRDRDCRERQKLKRQRRAEKKRLAAVQDTAPADGLM